MTTAASSMVSIKEKKDDLSSLTVSSEYRTGQSNMITEFYSPCLSKASSYDRAVGYFRSTIFAIINREIIPFAKAGGKIRIICSPFLSEADIKSMQEGYKSREEIISGAIDTEFEQMISQHEAEDRTIALATLIALNVVDVKLAIRAESLGMYHEKLGIFKDSSGNAVSFKGSANETWNGWHESGNFESIEVFCSWENDGDSERVRRHVEYFEELWAGNVPAVETVDFPSAVKAKLCRIAKDDIDKIIIADPVATNRKKTTTREPFPHQINAIENWKAQGYRGIFEHATGSGKTFTAIVAIQEHLKSSGTVLVLVPSKLLLRQWAKELKEEIPEASILKAGDGNDGWKRGSILRDFTVLDNELPPRIVLATLQTAASDAFVQKICAGSHLLVVADEVHQSGSPENSKLYQIDAGKRLGLSATPIRYGDPEGTAKMFEYFGKVVEPIFTLHDAINSGRLVEYEYFPHAINLNAEEADRWKDLSEQISREVARSPKDSNGGRQLSERAKMLLIQRSRVAKKASAKVTLALKVLSENYQEGEKWLVYCEDKGQLAEVLTKIRELNLHVNEYHTSMFSDMDSTLEWFKRHGGILVSIRCLDEGIDIPDISHALILASSQNPRQFIQRRGRVLRRAPGKLKATLHDAIVVPTNMEEESEQLALVKSEFCRAIEFAEGAINKSSGAQLKKMAIDLGLDIENLANTGMESEEI